MVYVKVQCYPDVYSWNKYNFIKPPLQKLYLKNQDISSHLTPYPFTVPINGTIYLAKLLNH